MPRFRRNASNQGIFFWARRKRRREHFLRVPMPLDMSGPVKSLSKSRRAFTSTVVYDADIKARW